MIIAYTATFTHRLDDKSMYRLKCLDIYPILNSLILNSPETLNSDKIIKLNINDIIKELKTYCTDSLRHSHVSGKSFLILFTGCRSTPRDIFVILNLVLSGFNASSHRLIITGGGIGLLSPFIVQNGGSVTYIGSK